MDKPETASRSGGGLSPAAMPGVLVCGFDRTDLENGKYHDGCTSGQRGPIDVVASVPLLTDDSQIGANLRICADEEDRADFDRRG